MMGEYEYMKALWAQFCQGSCGVSIEIPDGSKEERRNYLRLIDSINEKNEDISLNSFVAGFKLAAGIAAEVAAPPFSFDEAEERKSAKKPL